MHKVRRYFKIQELVDPEVYKIFGDGAWKFFDSSVLDSLLICREKIGRPITINNWMWGGKFTQRGLRHNRSSLVKSKNRIYLSAHMFGKAIDFDVEGVKAENVRKWIVDNADLFPHKIRLENNLNGKQISWVHLDTLSSYKDPKIYLFDV